jgi:enoyl-CoA hydratase/carnithine racemase
VGCVVITGNGPSFSAGGNIREMQRQASPEVSEMQIRALLIDRRLASAEPGNKPGNNAQIESRSSEYLCACRDIIQ